MEGVWWRSGGCEVEVTIKVPGDGGDEDAHGGPDKGRGVAHRRQALRLDEHRHLEKMCG